MRTAAKAMGSVRNEDCGAKIKRGADALGHGKVGVAVAAGDATRAFLERLAEG